MVHCKGNTCDARKRSTLKKKHHQFIKVTCTATVNISTNGSLRCLWNLADGVTGVVQYKPEPGRMGLIMGGGVYGGILSAPL